MPRPLNKKQRAALEYVAQGMTQSEAGRKAGYSVNNAPKVVSMLLKRDDAKQYLQRIIEASQSPMILDVRQRKEHLSKIATSQLSTPGEQMAAIHLLNKMDGIYVTKLEADVKATGGIMIVPMAMGMDDWQEKAMQSQAALMADAVEITG